MVAVGMAIRSCHAVKTLLSERDGARYLEIIMEDTKASEALVIEFETKALAPVAVFMGQRDIRYYLNGICVLPNKSGEGCFVVGCDGHRLAIWHDRNGVCTKQTVLNVGKELISASRKKAARDGENRDPRLWLYRLSAFSAPGI